MYDDKPMVLNYALSVYGLWYDKALFDAARAGSRPRRWDDFMALCEEIKGAGMAPMATRASTPTTSSRPCMDLAVKHGGHEVIYAIDSLEPDAWKNESMKMAAEALLEIKAKGYMLEGTEGLDHIQSQTALERGQGRVHPLRLVAGERAEERGAAGVRDDRRADPAARRRGAAVRLHPDRGGRVVHRARRKAKNVAGGMEFLRIMLSKEGAAKFTELTAAPTVVDGADRGHRR